MSITVYGIPNCGSVKKKLDELRQAGLAFEFHDFKKQGISETLLDQWLAVVPWDTLLNRKGTTWRNLSEDVKAHVVDAATAKAVMLNNPSAIKRPVVVNNGKVTAGLSKPA
jgi:arsenate reductase